MKRPCLFLILRLIIYIDGRETDADIISYFTHTQNKNRKSPVFQFRDCRRPHFFSLPANSGESDIFVSHRVLVMLKNWVVQHAHMPEYPRRCRADVAMLVVEVRKDLCCTQIKIRNNRWNHLVWFLFQHR